jgi:hypothetical protein
MVSRGPRHTREQITADVRYDVYRGSATGFAVDGASRIASDLSDTTYTDPVSDTCATFFYRVIAEACGQDGLPTPEASISLPARPSCPLAVMRRRSSRASLVSWSPDDPCRRNRSPRGTSDRIGSVLADPRVYTDSASAPSGR